LVDPALETYSMCPLDQCGYLSAAALVERESQALKLVCSTIPASALRNADPRMARSDGGKMKRSRILKLGTVLCGVMTLTMGVLNSGVSTRRAKAFSVLTVTSTANGGAGTLRDAINASAPGDTLTFNLPLPATIKLTTGELFIEQNLTIAGPGANLLTVSGENNSGVFFVASAANAAISGLTIANGLATGAGILNQGTLSVTNCIFSNNSANTGNGGAIATGPGGAGLTITGCTFAGNSGGTNGGAIFAFGGTVSLVNSTFKANFAVNGGALFVGAATVTVVNCTISGNSGGGIGSFPLMGAKLNLQSTIVANSTLGSDCAMPPGEIGVNSHNLIQDGSCSPMLSGDPMLGPLQNNGGSTPTMALLAGSPAIDAGDDSVLGSPLFLTTDQRGAGFPRKSGSHVDIGAFELQVGPSFDTCLKDNSTGNLFQFSSTTGQYLFTRCADSFTLSGTGTVALVNSIRTLRDIKPDRKISAGFNNGQLTGSVTIYLKVAPGVWQLFQIHDTNPSAVCKC
jgi:hypothetical protein